MLSWEQRRSWREIPQVLVLLQFAVPPGMSLLTRLDFGMND